MKKVALNLVGLAIAAAGVAAGWFLTGGKETVEAIKEELSDSSEETVENTEDSEESTETSSTGNTKKNVKKVFTAVCMVLGDVMTKWVDYFALSIFFGGITFFFKVLGSMTNHR